MSYYELNKLQDQIYELKQNNLEHIAKIELLENNFVILKQNFNEVINQIISMFRDLNDNIDVEDLINLRSLQLKAMNDK